MRGAKRLTPTRPGIDVAAGVSRWTSSSFPSCTWERTCPRSFASPLPSENSVNLEIFGNLVLPSLPTSADPPGTQTLPQIDVEEKLKSAFDRGWSVIVWNDPVNLMDYVVYVFKTVLKMNEKDASKHMWEVHQRGKSQVARETREKSELMVHRLRSFGLNATMEQEPA
jgi:ATP-dependent Clp protease adaptor protein ClpS